MSETNGTAAVATAPTKTDNAPPELCIRHRPTQFSEMVGQKDAVRTLRKMVKDNTIPHAILFTGPSGCGKTTLARILKEKLRCDERLEKGNADFVELNCADARGIEDMRNIKQRMGGAPIAGPCRVYLLDECQQLTPEAQSLLLKMLEDTPSHVYFMLATTDPAKLKNTIHTRCTEIRLTAIADEPLKELIKRTAEAEGKTVSDELASRIVECVDGSGRKALVLLLQVLGIDDEQQRLELVLKSEVKTVAHDLCKALTDRKMKWKDVAPIILSLENEQYESIRIQILAWAAGSLLKRHDKLCFYIICCFEGNRFETGAVGKASLVRACFEVLEKRGN